MRSEAEPALIAQARHDRAAFAALYDLYVTRVYAFCAVHSTSREDAEDLTAQTFERALHAISHYEERGQPFSAWLLRIAAHAAANHARRATTVPLHSEGPSHGGDDGAAAAATQAESWVEEWERADWIEDHLAALPPRSAARGAAALLRGPQLPRRGGADGLLAASVPPGVPHDRGHA